MYLRLHVGAVLAAMSLWSCAGPAEVLRKSKDQSERLEAIEALRTTPEPTRIEALAGVLVDEDAVVADASANLLLALGDEGEAALTSLLEKEGPGHCVAAAAVAAEAAKTKDEGRSKTLIKWLGPLKRSGSSCVLGQFAGMGAAAHPHLLAALASGEKQRQRRAAILGCLMKPDIVGAVRARAEAKPPAKDAALSLGALLAAKASTCGARPEEVWNVLFTNVATRALAAKATIGLSGRTALLRGAAKAGDACMKVDVAMLLGSPDQAPTAAAVAQLEKWLADPEARSCPSMSSSAYVAGLLAGGLSAGGDTATKARLELLERLGWKPETTKGKIQAAILMGQWSALRKFEMKAAEPMLNAYVAQQGDSTVGEALLAVLSDLGGELVPAVTKRLEKEAKFNRRDRYLKVLAKVAPREQRTMGVAVLQELERSTDATGLTQGGEKRQKRMLDWLAISGRSGIKDLAKAVRADGKMPLRVVLFKELVNVDGSGKTCTPLARSLLGANRDDALTQEATRYLAQNDEAWAEGQVLRGLKKGKLTPPQARLLGMLRTDNPKGMAKVIKKALKKQKSIGGLTNLARNLGKAGAHKEALAAALKGEKKLAKLQKKAKKKGGDTAAFQAQRDALSGVAKAEADALVKQALDPELSPKKAAKSLKWLTKKAKKIDVTGATIQALKKAAGSADNKKVRKAAKKLLKKL